MKKILLLIALISLPGAGFTQFRPVDALPDSTCIESLNKANSYYLTGQFLRCIEELNSVMGKCDFTRHETEFMYELMARAYVETGDIRSADHYVQLLLKKIPHYDLNEAENPEMFNRLVKKYEIHPMLIIGVKNTGDFLRHKTLKGNSVLSGLDYSQPFEEQGYFFTYYGSAEYEFIKGLSINIDGMFFYSTYERYFWKDPGFELIYWEKDRFIEFPVYLKKYFYPGSNFRFYIAGGFGPFYNYWAKGNVSLSYTKDDLITGKNEDFDGYMYDFNMLPLKDQVTWQWNGGAGIGYYIKNLRFFVDIRYLGGMQSITAPEKADLIPDLRDKFFYLDQDMKINQFEVGLTISYTLYNSVKRIRK